MDERLKAIINENKWRDEIPLDELCADVIRETCKVMAEICDEVQQLPPNGVKTFARIKQAILKAGEERG